MDVSGGGINALLFTLFFAGISSFLLRFFLKYLWTPWAIHGALKKQGFKGPPPRFMLGNLLDIANIMQQELLTDMASVDHNFRKRAFPYLVEWSRRYGEKFVIWFGYEPRIVLTDAELIRQLLSSKHLNDCGRSPLVQKMVSVLFGRGVFSVNGEQWSHQRRIVAPGFNMEKLKASVDIMSKCTKELVNEWSEITESAGGGNCEIELTKYMDKLTANIILSAEFGMRDGQLGKELFEDLMQLEELMMQSFRFLWMPGSRYIPTPTNVEIWKRTRRLDSNLKNMIEERRGTGSYGNDLLGLMLREIDRLSSADDSKRVKYTTQQLMDECKTFFLAGRETTSVLLSWAILLLALHPDWQDKAREEAISISQNHDILSMNSLGKLKIIGMVLNETMRLYPPGAGIVRQAFKDLKLGEDMVIPKGVNVIIDILAVHRNPKYWGGDANEFRPERFRDGVAAATGNHPSAFIPFSSGPRVCIGQNFAVLEAKVALSIILKHFKFTFSPSYRHAPVAFVTINPQHGVPIIVERVHSG